METPPVDKNHFIDFKIGGENVIIAISSDDDDNYENEDSHTAFDFITSILEGGEGEGFSSDDNYENEDSHTGFSSGYEADSEDNNNDNEGDEEDDPNDNNDKYTQTDNDGNDGNNDNNDNDNDNGDEDKCTQTDNVDDLNEQIILARIKLSKMQDRKRQLELYDIINDVVNKKTKKTTD